MTSRLSKLAALGLGATLMAQPAHAINVAGGGGAPAPETEEDVRLEEFAKGALDEATQRYEREICDIPNDLSQETDVDVLQTMKECVREIKSWSERVSELTVVHGAAQNIDYCGLDRAVFLDQLDAALKPSSIPTQSFYTRWFGDPDLSELSTEEQIDHQILVSTEPCISDFVSQTVPEHAEEIVHRKYELREWKIDDCDSNDTVCIEFN